MFVTFQQNIFLRKDYGSLHFCFLDEMYVWFNFCPTKDVFGSEVTQNYLQFNFKKFKKLL